MRQPTTPPPPPVDPEPEHISSDRYISYGEILVYVTKIFAAITRWISWELFGKSKNKAKVNGESMVTLAELFYDDDDLPHLAAPPSPDEPGFTWMTK